MDGFSSSLPSFYTGERNEATDENDENEVVAKKTLYPRQISTGRAGIHNTTVPRKMALLMTAEERYDASLQGPNRSM
jgi:hypothetical protein